MLVEFIGALFGDQSAHSRNRARWPAVDGTAFVSFNRLTLQPHREDHEDQVEDDMYIMGGPAIPARIEPQACVRHAPAIKVINAHLMNRPVRGGGVIPIIVLNDTDIVDNGGPHSVMSGAAIPMLNASSGCVQGGPAILVYPVDANGDYDPSFASDVVELP